MFNENDENEMLHWADLVAKSLGKRRRLDSHKVAEDAEAISEILIWDNLDRVDDFFDQDDLFDMPEVNERQVTAAIITAVAWESFHAAFRAAGTMLSIDPAEMEVICSYWFEEGAGALRPLQSGEMRQLIEAKRKDDGRDLKAESSALIEKMLDLGVLSD